MQFAPAFNDMCLLLRVTLALFKRVHGLQQLLEWLIQLMSARIALGPSDARSRLLESRRIPRGASQLLKFTQASDVFAQKLRAEQTLLLRNHAFEVFK